MGDAPKETPAERTLRLIQQRPEILEACARNLYEHTTEDTDWAEMPEFERQSWRARVLDLQNQVCHADPFEVEHSGKAALRAVLDANNQAFG